MLNNQLTYDDLLVMKSDKRMEDQYLEFKADYTKSGDPKIEDPKNRRSIAEEICAFLNTTGGTLLLGMSEAGGEGHHANEIEPIPDVRDTARKLKEAMGGLIEPYPNGLEFDIIVENESDSEGVIKVSIPRSSDIPHSVRSKDGGAFKVMVRRGDTKQPVRIADVRNMVLQQYSEAQEVNDRIDNAVQAFQKQLQTSNAGNRCTGFQVFLTPTRSFQLPPLWQYRNALSVDREFIWQRVDGSIQEIASPIDVGGSFSRNALRGLRFVKEMSHLTSIVEVSQFGSINAMFFGRGDVFFENNENCGKLFFDGIIGSVPSIHQIAEKLEKLGLPATREYLARIQVMTHKMPSTKLSFSSFYTDAFTIADYQSPTYRFSSEEELCQMCSEARYDLLCHGEQSGDIEVFKTIRPKLQS